MRFIFPFSFLLFTCTVQAQFHRITEPLAHTFSVVARDPQTGEMAVAVQSHWFSVGTSVSWAEAGVGAIATQSFTNKSFGLRGLALLKQGKSAQETLDILLKDDPGREVRQVAIVDARGRVAAHTGTHCIAYAGHYTGNGFSVQANMMLTDKVIPAMRKAFEQNARLPLAERLLKVLDAAQAAGGDIRGKQSAALIVVAAKASAKPWDDRLIDLRVDDNPAPLPELNRLLKVYRAYEHMNKGDLAIEKNEMQKAMQEYGAAQKMFPYNLEMQYWTAITLANNKQVAAAAAILKSIYQKEPNWRELTRRLPKAGLLTVSDKEWQQLLHP